MNLKLEFWGYNEKNMGFHLTPKKYYFWFSPEWWECDRHKDLWKLPPHMYLKEKGGKNSTKVKSDFLSIYWCFFCPNQELAIEDNTKNKANSHEPPKVRRPLQKAPSTGITRSVKYPTKLNHSYVTSLKCDKQEKPVSEICGKWNLQFYWKYLPS